MRTLILTALGVFVVLGAQPARAQIKGLATAERINRRI